jgi:hypothetical protein
VLPVRLLRRPCSKGPAAAQLLSELPKAYRVVVGFVELGPDSGTQHMVLLREWTPAWAPEGEALQAERNQLN